MKFHFPKSVSMCSSVALALGFLLSVAMPPAVAADVNQTTGTALVLQGSGTRVEGTHALYTAQLYAAPNAVLKQLQVVMARDVAAAEMQELLARGLVANVPGEVLSRLIPELFGLGELIGAQRELCSGEGFVIVSNPDHSTTIRIHGRDATPLTDVTFDQPELFPVMLKIWLGPQPVDGALKQALLSGQPS